MQEFEKWWSEEEKIWYEPSATYDVGLLAELAWRVALKWILSKQSDCVECLHNTIKEELNE